MESRDNRWGLLCRRQCLVPTWRGWVVSLFGLALLATLAVRGVYPFLAQGNSESASVLVVAGWEPDFIFSCLVSKTRERHYDRVFVIGGPLDKGGPLSPHPTFAEVGAARLIQLGMDPKLVQAVPAPFLPQDRIYTAGVSLRQWWRAHGATPPSVNLVVVGPGARRSRLVFRDALGGGVTVGVIVFPPRDYDPRHWWRCSQGFRTLTSELIGYCYAKFLFGKP